MGFHTSPWQVSLVLAALCAAAGDAASQQAEPGRCGHGRYWNLSQQRCADCTPCVGAGREVTLRACSGHRDALCGSFSDLPIDWSWLHSQHAQQRTPRPEGKGVHEWVNSMSEAEALLRDELRHLPPQQHKRDRLVDFGDDFIVPDHPRQRQPKKHRKPKQSKLLGDLDDFSDFGASGVGVGDPVSDDEDLAQVSWHRSHSRHRTPPAPAHSQPPATTSTTTTTTARPTTPVSQVEDFIVVKDGEGDGDGKPRTEDVVVATSPSFSTVETLVWDWQAGVLVAAVCACLLFFVVAAAYSCQHAWHFKKLKKHLDADMEEISARLALMSGMGAEHFHDPAAAGLAGADPEKAALAVRRGDHLRAGRQQNEYCVASLPKKTRV